MKKVTVHEPIVLAQSTTEPVFKGGYQDPHIRCYNGVIYVRFNSRRDSGETFGLEENNPVYKTKDEGKTWEKVSDPKEWTFAQKPLSNGDRLVLREQRTIFVTDEEIAKFPKVPKSRERVKHISYYTPYTADELYPILGDKIRIEIPCNRIKSGTNEVVEEICTVNWKNFPFHYDNKMIIPTYASCEYKEDKNGVLWMTVFAAAINDNGEADSPYYCTHLLRSDDFGHTWDYVNTILYKDEYNKPNMRDIEGFNECALECLDDGSIIFVLRSGSLYPFPPLMGDKDHPAPYVYMAKTSDGGKTFDFIKPFYDYGIRPASVKLGCGTIVLVSGRPGVYIRTCNDPKGENWDDVIPILTVPEEDLYERYWQYSCSNCGITAYDDNTAFITYSNFKIPTPQGESAKSIIVQKITVE